MSYDQKNCEAMLLTIDMLPDKDLEHFRDNEQLKDLMCRIQNFFIKENNE